jgi:hypothetical protein
MSPLQGEPIMGDFCLDGNGLCQVRYSLVNTLLFHTFLS